MDPVLARMFDLDRPLSERIEEGNVKEGFVKAASDLGADLSKMADADVNTLYGQYLAMYYEKKAQLTKEAELIRIGRLLAHQMFKQAQDSPMDLMTAPEEHFRGHISAMAGDPLRRVELLRNQDAYVSAGARPEAFKEIWKQHLLQSGAHPDQVDTLAGERTAHLEDIYKKKGVHVATERSLRGVTNPAQAMTPEELLSKYRLGSMAEAPSAWSKWGPSGLLKALGEGDLATAGRKALPIGGVALGLGYLMKKRNEEKERQLAAMGMGGGGGGMSPAVGV
jgi:hypothetical protein